MKLTGDEFLKFNESVRFQVLKLQEIGFTIDEDDISAITLILLECKKHGIYGKSIDNKIKSYFENKIKISTNEVLFDNEELLNDLIFNSKFEKEIKELNLRFLYSLLDILLDNNYLKEREVFVIKKYYFENLTLSQIGKLLNRSPERVRQSKIKAERKIKHFFKNYRINSISSILEEKSF